MSTTSSVGFDKSVFRVADVTCLTSFCTSEYQPVCGSDGQTYQNLCAFSNALLCSHTSELTVAYDGACLPRKYQEIHTQNLHLQLQTFFVTFVF